MSNLIWRMNITPTHLHFHREQQALSVPLLHIIEETIKEIPHPAKKAVVLGTEPTIQSAIYQKGLEANGQEVVHKDHWQQAVNQLIAGIKQPNHIQHTQALWQKLYEEISQHADIIISACTDLNAVLDHIQSEIPIIDSSDCLAKSTVSTYLAYQS